MNKLNSKITMSLALFLITFLSSCEMIGNIFKGGIYVGVILVIVVVGLVFWLISSMRK